MHTDLSSSLAVQAVSAALSQRLGHHVVVDKVANRIIIREEGERVAGEVTEQQLLAAVDPIGFMVEHVQRQQ